MSEERLLPYQKEWILNDNKYSIWLKARRIGATFAEALWSVRKRLQQKSDHYFISMKEQTALEFINYCRKWAEIYNLRGPLIDLKAATNNTLNFRNGSRIIALSANPDGMRGLGSRYTTCSLDEFSFSENPERLFEAAKPLADWDGSLRIISTHNGPATVFAELISKAPGNGFKIYRTDLLQAVEQGLAQKVPGDHLKLPTISEQNQSFINERRITSLSEDSFRQEYLCETTTSSTVISEEEYNKCVFNNLPVATTLNLTDHYNNLSVGVDIGRSKNLTVIWIIEEGQDPKAPNEQLKICYRTVCQIELQNVPYSAQYQQIDAVISHPSVVKCVIDQGAIGAQLSEDLKSKWGYKVVPMSINHTSKARLIERVKKFIAQKRITLPSDIETKKDIISMKRVAMKSGGFTYDGQSGQSHCDRFLALSMALEAAESMAQFELIPQSREFTH